MKTLLIITGIALLGAVSLLIKGSRDGKSEEPKDGTIITYPDERIFSEFEEDKYSPEQLETDKILKVLELRNKLNGIEKERGMN